MTKRPFHLAALSLLSWYLIAPPMQRANNAVKVDDQAPLSQWTVARQFTTQDDCKNFKGIPPKGIGTLGVDYLTECKCVESDDPRIKGIKFAKTPVHTPGAKATP